MKFWGSFKTIASRFSHIKGGAKCFHPLNGGGGGGGGAQKVLPHLDRGGGGGGGCTNSRTCNFQIL